MKLNFKKVKGILSSPKLLLINRQCARHIDSGFDIAFTLREQHEVKIEGKKKERQTRKLHYLHKLIRKKEKNREET